MRLCTDVLIGTVSLVFGASAASAAVLISLEPTQNMSCSAGVCTPTAVKAVLNVGDLVAMLASGDTTVETTGSSIEAKDITINEGFSWGSGNTLTLDAFRSVTVNKSVLVQGLAGLSILTDDGGSEGLLLFGKRGNVTFDNVSSSLSINGTAYKLENSIASLASAIANDPSGAYGLANDYDASSDGTYHNNPVATRVVGIVEGLGHKVSHVRIRASGFFAEVQTSGSVMDMRLTRTNVAAFAAGTGVGGLVATNYGDLSGDTVSVRMNVGGTDFVGGLAGENNGTITRSSAQGKIEASGSGQSTGGLVGYNAGTVSLSSATSTVEESADVGDVGGLIGQMETGGAVTQSFATGTVRGGDITGGLVGVIYAGSVSDSYSTSAAIAADLYAGGFAGDNDGAISSSYSTGAPTAMSYTGGFIGINYSRANGHCYWDTTTSNIDYGVGHGHGFGIIGLTTTQLQSGLPAGFKRKIWAENPNINNGLPYLINNPPPK